MTVDSGTGKAMACGRSTAGRSGRSGRLSLPLLLSVLMGIAISVQAGTGTGIGVDPADVQREATEDPMVCKRFVPTGSRIQRRFCRRQSEWEAMAQSGRQAVRDAITEESQFGYRGVGPGGTNPY